MYYLGIEGVLVAIVRDMELDGRAGAVAVQHVVYAALDIHDERHFDHHQIQFVAEVILDIALHLENGALRLLGA